MKRISILLTLALVSLLSAPAGVFGEYYQYTDKDGAVRFTDDPSMIPEDQQPQVKIFESIRSGESQPSQNMPEETAPPEEVSKETAAAKETETDTGAAKPSVGGVNHEKADELNAMREKLHKTFADLEAEKASIGPPPPKNAKSGVRADYTYKVTELNRKIDAYQQQSKEFDEKVKAFNSQAGKE